MVFLGKLKLIDPNTPKHYNNCSAPTFLISFKTFLPPPPFKKKGRDYAFFMREYKIETIKLLPFHMTDFLFTELQRHNIWRKLKNHMKNDMPNNIFRSYLNICDRNLRWYQIHRIIIKFHHKISLALWDQSLPTASGGLFFVTHKKCIFLEMSAKFVFKNSEIC